MFQTIQGIDVFVVDFAEIPTLPIHDGGIPEFTPYAYALDAAIRQGILTKPGKYAINVSDSGRFWNIFTIEE